MKKNKVDKLLELVESSYNEVASEFSQTRKKELWPKLKELGDEVFENALVLDLACGNGRLLEAFGNKKINYLGVDSSRELIKIAKKDYPDFSFKVANMVDFKGEKKYDYIFCIAALQHIPSHKLRLEVLSNIKNYLARDGKLIISNWNIWESPHRFKLYKATLKKIIGLNKLAYNDIVFPWKDSKGRDLSDRYYHAFTKRELVSLASKAGYLEIKLKKDKYNYWLTLKN